MALGGELALNVLWQLDRILFQFQFRFLVLPFFVNVFLVFFILIVGFIVKIAAAVAVGLLF